MHCFALDVLIYLLPPYDPRKLPRPGFIGRALAVEDGTQLSIVFILLPALPCIRGRLTTTHDDSNGGSS
jgi:hypothetical protein